MMPAFAMKRKTVFPRIVTQDANKKMDCHITEMWQPIVM
jgi:hypothetical protein